MHKLNTPAFIRSIKTSITRHSPEILTGIGIAGMITTTVLAVKATPKALQLIDMEIARQNREIVKEARDNDQEECNQIHKLKPIEVIRTTWKCYIPTAVTCLLSTSCLIGASSVNLKRNAALATAYKLSETALTEYKEKVVETIGEKKEQDIRDELAKDRIEKNPVGKNEVIITNKGETLCYDALSGRYFKSSMDLIKKAENDLNKQMLNEGYVSLNDFYDYLDLDHTSVGDQLGWNTDNRLVEMQFSSQIAEDGTPCLVIIYSVEPKYNFYRFA